MEREKRKVKEIADKNGMRKKDLKTKKKNSKKMSAPRGEEKMQLEGRRR